MDSLFPQKSRPVNRVSVVGGAVKREHAVGGRAWLRTTRPHRRSDDEEINERSNTTSEKSKKEE